MRNEWNRAEEVVKAAEQICGETVIPSVKELRYAGRRLIDALNSNVSSDPGKVRELLNDAIFNCHCARHDAIDVATAVVALNLDITTNKIGFDNILRAFPRFADLRKQLSTIRGKIRTSRSNRGDRDLIYQVISETDLPVMASLYDEFQLAEDIMKGLARKDRRGKLIDRLLTIASVLAAFGLLVFSGMNALKKPQTIPIYIDSATGKVVSAPAPAHK